MDFRVLGPVAAFADGAPVRLGGPKQRTVLALLLHDADRVVSADVLIDGVWEDEATPAAKSTLQSYVFNLRAVIGEQLVTEGGGYRLAVDRDRIDAFRFEDAATKAAAIAAHSPLDAATLLREALALWDGHPYSGLAPSTRLESEARRLEELRRKALEDRVEAELALGHHAELIPELEVLAAEFPLSERFRAQQMLALYRAGRQSEALRAYDKVRRYLAEELGLDPAPAVRKLHQRILTQDPELELETEPRVQTVTVLMTDLEDAPSLWELHAESMGRTLQRHDQIIGDAVEAAGGRVVSKTGDGVTGAFDTVASAVSAAESAQRSLTAEDWPIDAPVRVRMGVDSGDVEARDGDLFGPPLNRCARLVAAGNGGQILLSEDAHAALSASGGAGWQAKALGEHHFRGLSRPQPVFQLMPPGLTGDFPPLRTDRVPSALPSLGRTVRGFELRERAGGGAFGVVFRAYQPSVGREAAVKVIRPEYVNQAEFVRRFEAEAQLVGQLEHPHIVPLYDYWRDPDGAYLVTRWLRGGSLRAVLDRGTIWGVDEALTLLNQVCGALAYAHRHGVVHRDVKPANVLLDEDGNAYLADFGIAMRSAATSPAVPSSPAYLAPEDLRGDPVTERTDIYSLGLVAFEVLSGRKVPMDGPLPPLASIRPELPSALDQVVARACASDPADRYESVEALLAAMTEAVGRPTGAVQEIGRTAARNPYKGLHAFQESDASDFYGRSDLVGELAGAVAEHRLVAVVGPSGIGKSSVIRAGLVPHLRASNWMVTDMLPGAFPFEELAAALLRVAVQRPENLVDDLAATDTALAETARRILPVGSRTLLVIDQFEELFTLTAEEDVRRRFIDGITALTRADQSPVSVLLTLRADFLDRPLRYPELGELLTAGTVMVAAPGNDELVEAVTRPAEGVGVRFEPGLVDRIATDVADQPGGLPLLQYALTELFDGRQSDVITATDYERAGGVLGALSGRAEELFAQLDAAGQEAARQIYLRLVTVGEAAQDTRRRVPRRELRGLPLDPAALEEVLDRFGSHRLLTFDRHPVTRAPTVEVAHEALLTRWDRLRGWIDDRRESLLLHRRLAESVDEWERSDRDADYLLGGGRLAQFETLASTDLALSEHERSYLDTSRAAADRQLTRRRRLRRALVGGLAVGLVVTTVLAAVAFVNQQRASEAADIARARELAAAAVATLGDDPTLSKLLAVASADVGALTTESVAALHQAWAADPVTARIAGPPFALGPLHADIHPAGDRAVVAGWGDIQLGWNYLEVLDLGTKEVIWTFRPEYNSAVPSRPLFSPDGAQVVTGVAWASRPWEGANPPPDEVGAFILDTETGEHADWFDLGRCGGFVDGVSDTHLLVKTLHGPAEQTCDWSGDAAVELLELASGRRELLVATGINGSPGAALSGDGRFVAVDDLDTGQASVLDLGSGETVVRFDSRPPFVSALNHDGSLLTYGDDPIDVWDVAAGEIIASYDGHEGDSFFASFHPSGTSIYSTGEDGNLHHWDARTGQALTVLPAIGHFRTSASGDGQVLVTRHGSTVSLLDTGVRGELGAVETCQGTVLRDTLKVTGRLAVFGLHCDGDPDATTHVVDLNTGEVRYLLPGHGAQALSISPDGTRFARQEADGAIHGAIAIRDLQTGEPLVELHGLCTYDDDPIVPLDDKDGCRPYPEAPFALWADRLRWSPDGTMIASSSRGGAIVWDATTGQLLFAEEIPERSPLGLALANYAFDVIFSPDSRRLIASGDADLRVFATDTWELDHTAVNNTVGGGAFGLLGFSTDGSTLLGEGGAVGAPLGTLTWLDAGTLEWVREVDSIHDAGVSSRAVSPDGSLVATGAADGLVRVWDAATGAIVHEVPFPTRVAGLAFADDHHLAVTLDGGNLLMVTIDADELLDLVRSSLTRGFTDAECQRFNFGDDCPTLAALRRSLSDIADLSVVNGAYRLEWTPAELVRALIEEFPEEELSEEFAEIAWAEAANLQRAGIHTLRFDDGRWDHTVSAGEVVWGCTGTYSVANSRIELITERGICDPTRLFDAEFEHTDGELRFHGYNGQPLDVIIYTARAWQRID